MKSTDQMINHIIENSKVILQNMGLLSYESENVFYKFVKVFYAHTNIEQFHILSREYSNDIATHLVCMAWSDFYKRTKTDDYHLQNYSRKNNKSHLLQVIHLIHDECPFLVDTITLLLEELGMKAVFEVHPLIYVKRNDDGVLLDIKEAHEGGGLYVSKELLISLLFDKEISTVTLSHFEERLHYRISKVQNIVAHFESYLTQMSSLSCYYLDQDFDPIAVDVGGFLSFLNQNNFVYLGSRQVPLNSTFSYDDTIDMQELGLFCFDEFKHEKDFWPFLGHKTILPSMDAAVLNTFGNYPPYAYIRRTSLLSVIHRRSRYISIEILDPMGRHIQQFIGLFTRQFYQTPQANIPALNTQLHNFKGLFSFDPKSMEEKFFESLIDLIPNDELYYLNVQDLANLLKRVIYHTNQVALHLNRPEGSSHTDVMLFIPNSHVSPEIKEHIQNYLEKVLDGTVIFEQTHMAATLFSYIHYVVDHHHKKAPLCAISELEEAINNLCHSWQENFDIEWKKQSKNISKRDLHKTIIFEKHYQQQYTVTRGIQDALHTLNAFKDDHQKEIDIITTNSKLFTVQVFTAEERIPLSRLMPIFESLGIDVVRESEFKIMVGQQYCYMQNFDCESTQFASCQRDNLIEAFTAIYHSNVEMDVLNTLVLSADLTIRKVAILRALIRSIKHMGYPTSIDYINRTVSQYPDLLKEMVDLMYAKFNPELKNDVIQNLIQTHIYQIEALFNTVTASDHDRILRHMYHVIMAIIRTNMYLNKEYISFKFNPLKVPDLPKPLPMYEIFVYAPFMEGVHLRAGKVARGGIRWSDRIEDFRLEVLDLVKAQNVKNAIIVPLGAKGGFICRNYVAMQQRNATPSALKEEVIRCYETFIQGLLDITDNIIDGKIVTPHQIVTFDDPDPYLVVAADKGTAQFSDIANRIAKRYNFWLGDAFASGGSLGYDHKKMGITSRGAWISVVEHLKKYTIDPAVDSFSVVGVGDMSGDVFGNGMLRSQHIRLIAAFDHRHIFIDPTPDEKQSFDERMRLFKLPESSWAHYREDYLSQGGGLYKRDVKSIVLSQEACTALGIDFVEGLSWSPDQVIQHILKAPVDLLWFGGIGTYIRASTELDRDVHDPSNAYIRVDAKSIRAKVIGEGANLAMTQKARIEYGMQGGLNNTDAIDNSAGVSCSDHEVNIKILCRHIMDAGQMTELERNALLATVIDDVAALILDDNVQQNRVLSLLQETSVKNLLSYKNLIHTMAVDKLQPLDPVLESLPHDKEFDERALMQKGLSRSELAILLAYSKISVFKHLLDTDEAKNTWTNFKYKDVFHDDLLSYFPELMQDRFSKYIEQHPLAIEILATRLSNDFLNDLGPIDAFLMFEINNFNYWNTLKAYKVITVYFSKIFDKLPHMDRVDAIKQMMMIYKRSHYDMQSLMIDDSPWLSLLPEKVMPLLCDLMARYGAENLKNIDVSRYVTLYDMCDRAFRFQDFSTVCHHLPVKDRMQSQVRAYLIDDWIKLQNDVLQHFLNKYGSEQQQECTEKIKTIEDQLIDTITLIDRILQGVQKNTYDFSMYYIRSLGHLIV